MTDTNRELVPDNWSLVRERVLTTEILNRLYLVRIRNVLDSLLLIAVNISQKPLQAF